MYMFCTSGQHVCSLFLHPCAAFQATGDDTICFLLGPSRSVCITLMSVKPRLCYASRSTEMQEKLP